MKTSIRPIILTILFCALILPILSCSTLKKPVVDRVILITLDTTRADHLACYGYGKIETPNIDSFAREGMLFTNAVCQVPLTLPSHATIMTGLYPPEHGVRYYSGYLLKDDFDTIAEILHGQGFMTGAVVSAYPVTRKFGLAQGFESYDDVFDTEEEEMPGLPPKIEKRASITIDSSIGWITRNKDQKFFLWIHLYDPHADYEPPPPFSEKYRDSLYDGEIAYMDSEIGRLWQFLKSEELWDDTFIIMLGDHGEGLGEHRELTHSSLLYDTTMRIPLIMKGKALPENRRIDDVAATIDIVPTILDCLSIPLPSGLKGKSLLEFAKGNTQGQRDIYMETLSPRINFGWSELFAVRRGKWKFIQGPVPELYDIEKDPGEAADLIDQETGVADELARELTQMEKGFELMAKGSSQTAMIDDESRDALLSLGYVSSSLSKEKKKQNKNPRDFVFLEDDLKKCPIAFNKKDYGEAIKICDSVLRIDPENKGAHQFKAWALMRTGKEEAAIDQLKKLLGIYADDMQGPRMLYKFYMKKKMFAEAEQVIRKALEYYPDSHMYCFDLAVCFYTQHRINEAIEWGERSISVNPEYAMAYALVASCYAVLGMHDKANMYTEEARRLGFKRDRPNTRSPQ